MSEFESEVSVGTHNQPSSYRFPHAARIIEKWLLLRPVSEMYKMSPEPDIMSTASPSLHCGAAVWERQSMLVCSRKVSSVSPQYYFETFLGL